jgi:RNA dependent RNA polymerase
MNPGCVLRFLNYSNSQIKRHSSWFLVGPEQVDENDPLFLGEKQIIESLGDFNFEKNILKRYARRG